MKSISPSALASTLGKATAPIIVDVRLDDDFAACHLPGAINNTVFEIAFHERVPKTMPDKAQSVVIYGASTHSHEATMAVEKLERAGFTDLAILEGGLEAWRQASHPLKEGAPLPAPAEQPHGRLELDLEECQLEWLGRNLLNKHSGTIAITAGHLDFREGTLIGGEFEFDLGSLQCTDLAGKPIHDILIRHLHDHDFLDAEHHPECRLTITGARPTEGAMAGSPNLTLSGELTLRGVTEAIEFDACSGLTPDGKPAAQAAFSIDRTRWGILYGSARYFHRLAGHLVNDLIEFQARIVTS